MTFWKYRIASSTGESGHDRKFVRLLNLEEEFYILLTVHLVVILGK